MKFTAIIIITIIVSGNAIQNSEVMKNPHKVGDWGIFGYMFSPISGIREGCV